MHLAKPISNLLLQLEEAISELSDQQYCMPVAVLSDTSIGQHLRHVIEFFDELNKGHQTGQVNYDLRQRDHRIETKRQVAIEKIREIGENLDKPDKDLLLTASFPVNGIPHIQFTSNYNRELLYNLEHTVHHMALIRIGIEAVSSTILSSHFGVAESTVQYRHACAQ
ncbi:MAG: hypothetical protein ABI480_12485 [Chitinophagaceae bacterium]